MELERGNNAGVYHSDNSDADGKCPACGADLVPPGRFCESCGKKIVDKSYGEIKLEVENGEEIY